MGTERFKGALKNYIGIRWKVAAGIFAVLTSLIIFAPSAKVFANPIPIPSILMPEEYIDIELTSIGGVIRAKVDGAYPFWNAGYETVDMHYPVPPDSENISVELDNEPLDWSYSPWMYPTIVGDWPMIRWRIYPAPQSFEIKTHYEHAVPVLDNVYTLVYAMGTGKYLKYWSKQTTAYVTVRINFAHENLKVYADSEPIDNYETRVENGVTILTLTRTSEEFQPLLEDLIVTFKLKLISILPSYQSGSPGENLSYTVRVTNIGSENDNYALDVTDTAGWNRTLSENEFENVPPGENRAVTLTVTIPENATSFTKDSILVTATSQENAEVIDADVCVAEVWGEADFKLENMYTVSLDENLWLGEGSKLVVKFYTYWDAFENEGVFENFTPPAHIVEFENVDHPENIGVKKVRLVPTNDNTDNVISTITSFTVTRGVLMRRLAEIDMEWSYASFERRSVLMSEITAIDVQWPYAPS